MNNNAHAKQLKEKQLGFVSLIIAICSGTTIFNKIKFISYTRAVSHLVLLSLICTVFITLVHIPSSYKRASDICTYLESTFGKLVVKTDGFYPQKAITQKRNLFFKLFNVEAGIMYYPEMTKENIDDFAKSSAPFNILWIPPNIIHCIKPKMNHFFAYQLNNNLLKLAFSTQNRDQKYFDKEQLYNYLINLTPITFSASETGTFSFSMFKISTAIGLLLPPLIVNLLQIPITAILYTLMVSLAYNLFNNIISSNMFKSLPLLQVMTVATYSCFPAILIGSLLECLNIEFIRFQQSFMFCFLAYFLIIISKLERDNLNKKRDLIRNKFNKQ